MKQGRTFSVVGRPRRRVDGRAKVTGQTRFADDIVLPRMLYCKLLRSPHPHARVKRIDGSRAEAHPGVHLVLTGTTMPIEFGILPVSASRTPSAAAARVVSMRLIRAWGCGERSSLQCSMRGSDTSSANRV